MDNPPTTTLSGSLLLAMPTLNDPNFAKSVILLCEHGPDGALGLIINRPLDLCLGEILQHLAIRPSNPEIPRRQIYSGGPVEPERGFVVHTAPVRHPDSIRIGETLVVSASSEVLAGLASNAAAASRFIVTLGYSGWGPGQLDREIVENAWLTIPASPALVFEIPVAERWNQAAARLGIDLSRLSGETGHA